MSLRYEFLRGTIFDILLGVKPKSKPIERACPFSKRVMAVSRKKARSQGRSPTPSIANVAESKFT